MDEDIKIYRYNDNIAFRQCSLAERYKNLTKGDCTCFSTTDEDFKRYYHCDQYGIHLHCCKHPEIELQLEYKYMTPYLKCSKCDNMFQINSIDCILQDCLKMLNIPKFKNAKLIRLDDWYIPEIKEKIELKSDYWIKADVKTDKDKDTIIVLYIGKKDSKEKVQYFIKPEKLQLTNDYKDLDPATIITKIEVTLKDRILKQEYEG